MRTAYAKSSLSVADAFAQWPRLSAQAYQSATHGERYVENYANAKAAAYGRFEEAGAMPVGSVLAKPSFVAHPNGRLAVGPLFVMEKMPAGFLEASGDWKYSMIMPNGSLCGQTRGVNSTGMKFCYECHAAAADNDHLFFLPEEYRASGN